MELKSSVAATRWLLHPLSVSSSLTTADRGEFNNHLLTISNSRTHVTKRSADVQSVARLARSVRLRKRHCPRTYRSLCPRESSMALKNERLRPSENITTSKNRAPLGFCFRRSCERVIGIRNSRDVATESVAYLRTLFVQSAHLYVSRATERLRERQRKPACRPERVETERSKYAPEFLRRFPVPLRPGVSQDGG